MTEWEKSEREKYEKVWARNEYRTAESPSLLLLKRLPILDWFKEYDVKSVLDAGCGSGKMLRRIQNLRPDLKLHGIDIADNAPNNGIRSFFTQGTIWNGSIYPKVDAIICVDVMEHVPEQYIGAVLSNFRQFAAKFVFLSICLVPDNFGSVLVNEPLHLTVKDHYWWFEQFASHGYKIKFCIGYDGLLEALMVVE